MNTSVRYALTKTPKERYLLDSSWIKKDKKETASLKILYGAQ